MNDIKRQFFWWTLKHSPISKEETEETVTIARAVWHEVGKRLNNCNEFNDDTHTLCDIDERTLEMIEWYERRYGQTDKKKGWLHIWP